MSTPRELTDVLHVADGPIRGFISNGMRQWLGIPYATPPVNDLRWRPPQPPKRWTETLEATEFGPICAQEEGAFPGFGSSSTSEDCLYLNVYAPTSSGSESEAPLPVMIWLHGGGLFQGASNDYNPEKLVRLGNVIFVCMNYRVNLFGFFSHPAINAEGHENGNYGIMDQQAALRWVQANIGAFGGDRDNVTIFGESAGGISTAAHMSSPASAGLFHKAIVQSGGSPFTFTHRSVEDLGDLGAQLAREAGCDDQTPENLRRLSTASLMRANALPKGQFGTTRFHFALMEDGVIIPRDLPQQFSKGNFAQVPLMTGVTKDEFAWFQGMMEVATGHQISEDMYPEILRLSLQTAVQMDLIGLKVPAEAFEQVLKLYPSGDHVHPGRAIAAALGDAGIISTGCRRAARIVKQHVPDVYVYEFEADDAPVSWPEVSFPYGSCHAQELQFLFPGFCGGSGKANKLSPQQDDLANNMVRYWTNFARAGTPSPVEGGEEKGARNQPSWPVYDPAVDNVMNLSAPSPKMISNWGARHHMDFWDSFYK